MYKLTEKPELENDPGWGLWVASNGDHLLLPFRGHAKDITVHFSKRMVYRRLCPVWYSWLHRHCTNKASLVKVRAWIVSRSSGDRVALAEAEVLYPLDFSEQAQQARVIARPTDSLAAQRPNGTNFVPGGTRKGAAKAMRAPLGGSAGPFPHPSPEGVPHQGTKMREKFAENGAQVGPARESVEVADAG